MTSRDSKGQGRDLNMFKVSISRKRLEIESRLQWNAYKKCYMGHQMTQNSVVASASAVCIGH